MTNYQIFNALTQLAGLCGIVYFFYGPWQKLIVDVIRQQLFELRDAVFDMALSGEIAFDSAEYTSYRNHINTLIRHVHSATFLNYMAIGLYASKVLKIRMDLKDSQLPFYQNEALKKNFNKACAWLGAMVWLRSPFLMTASLILFVLLPIAILALAISGHMRTLPKLIVRKIGQEIKRNAELSAESEGYIA